MDSSSDDSEEEKPKTAKKSVKSKAKPAKQETSSDSDSDESEDEVTCSFHQKQSSKPIIACSLPKQLYLLNPVLAPRGRSKQSPVSLVTTAMKTVKKRMSNQNPRRQKVS